MAGNSIQQYFPRVRYETKNEHTSLILDGASKSAVLVVPKGKKVAILSTPVAVLGKKKRYYFRDESSIVKEPRKIIRTILR